MIQTATSAPSAQKKLPNGWRWVQLDDLIVEAKTGFACGERDPQGVVQLRMNNVTSQGKMDWSSFLRVPAVAEIVKECRLEKGDVLFNNTNSAELVGKTAYFEGYGEPVVFSNHFTRLRSKKELMEPRFLAYWLFQQWEQGVFERICNRWIGQAAVKPAKLLSLELALPPLAEQKRIVAILNEQMAAVEKARAAAEAQLEAINIFPSALLRQAFNGEL